MAANANYNQTIGETPTVIFQSSPAGGQQRRGAIEITIVNGDDSEILLVNSDEHHASDEWMPILPLTSQCIAVTEGNGEIRTVKLKRGGSSNVSGVGWGVTKMGKGTANL